MPVSGVPKAQAQHFELAFSYATRLHLPAHQRTDLPEPGVPEEAAHIHPKMLLIELTLTQGPST